MDELSSRPLDASVFSQTAVQGISELAGQLRGEEEGTSQLGDMMVQATF